MWLCLLQEIRIAVNHKDRKEHKKEWKFWNHQMCVRTKAGNHQVASQSFFYVFYAFFAVNLLRSIVQI